MKLMVHFVLLPSSSVPVSRRGLLEVSSGERGHCVAPAAWAAPVVLVREVPACRALRLQCHAESAEFL